jgi:hypothetical protein
MVRATNIRFWRFTFFICPDFFHPLVADMPKAAAGLYNHNTRNTLTRQLKFSTDSSGRSSYSYTSSQVRLDPVVPEAHREDESNVMDASMDIYEDHVNSNDNEDVGQVVEVMRGVRVVTKPKAKRYDNSVSSP